MGKFGFSFSWKRAIGLSAAKGKLSKKIGIPLTRAGRQRKVGQMAGCCVPFLLLCSLVSLPIALAHPGRTDANGGHHDRKNGGYHYHNGGSSGSSATGESGSSSGTNATGKSETPNTSSGTKYRATPYVPQGPPRAEGGWSEPEAKAAEKVNVYCCMESKEYHTTKTCGSIGTEKPITLSSENAKRLKYSECAICFATTESKSAPDTENSAPEEEGIVPSPSPSPLIPLLEKAIGPRNRDGAPALHVEDYEEHILIRFAINDNLTTSFIKGGAQSDTLALLEVIKKERPGCSVTINGTLSMIDPYGNQSEESAIVAKYTAETISKINFSNKTSISGNVWELAESASINKEFR